MSWIDEGVWVAKAKLSISRRWQNMIRTELDANDSRQFCVSQASPSKRLDFLFLLKKRKEKEGIFLATMFSKYFLMVSTIFAHRNIFSQRNTNSMRILILLILAFLSHNTGLAQNIFPTKYSIQLNSDNVYSTHDHFFYGASVVGVRQFQKRWALGLGLEYSFDDFHFDNGYNLYELQFKSIFLAQKYAVLAHKKWQLGFSFREGISFSKYQISDAYVNTAVRATVVEHGLYGYAGIYGSYQLSNHCSLHTELGIKSFHISTDELAVNPHGVNIMVGLSYDF